MNMKSHTPTRTSPESESTSIEPRPKELTLAGLLLKSSVLALGIFLVLMLITALVVAVLAYQKYRTFLQAAELTHQQVLDLYSAAQTTQPQAQSGNTVILILGIDTVENKATAPPLTDTMMLASVDTDTATVTTLSLPRDLWSESYQTKINALYYYGIERYPDRPEQFVEEAVVELTGVPIDYTLLVDLDSVAEVIDLIGGLTINIPMGFVDTQFPRSDILPNEATSEAELYTTVSFSPGDTVLSGEEALGYIRSRFSEGDTGTDLDRSARQQLVISSLITQLNNPRAYIREPELLGRLYQWYQARIDAQLPTTAAAALGLQLIQNDNQVAFKQAQFPIYPDSEYGIIEHPPVSQAYQRQWVYIIRDRAAFATFVQDALGGSEQ